MRYQPSSLGSFWVSADGYELQMKGNSQNSRSYANFEAVAAFALLARALASALASTLALGLACSLANLGRTYHKNKSKQSRAHAATPTSTATALLEAYTTPGQAGPRPEEHTKMLPLSLSLLLPSLLLLSLYCCCCCCCRFTASKFRRRRRWHRFSLSGSAALLCAALLHSLWLVGLWTGAAQSVRCRQLTCTVCGAEVRIS